MELSDEQKRRMEENRLRAVRIRAQKTQNTSISNNHPPHVLPKLAVAQMDFQANGNVTQSVSSKLNVHQHISASSEENGARSFTNLNLPISNKVKATCILISNKRFQVRTSFFGPLIELFKTSKTKLYDTQSKQWSFDLSEYEFIKNDIQKKMGTVVEFELLPKIVLSVFSRGTRGDTNATNDELKVDLSKIDTKLLTSLLPFQKDGVEFCIRNNGRLMIADDMGLGKTLQAIAVAAYYKEEWPLLIISPSSVKFTWLQQLSTWLPSLSRDRIKVMLKRSEDCSSCDILISSYDLVAKNMKEIMSRRFKVVIVDESHLLKSSNTLRTKNVTPILKQAKRMIMLSGTPALSRPIELFSQLTCIDLKVFNNVHEYGVRYCGAKKNHWGWDYSGSSNLTELKLVLEEKYLIRRMKAEVLQQLPRKYRTMVVLDPNLIRHNKSMRDSHNAVEKSKCTERKCLLEYFHKTAEAKLDAICKYVLELLESGKKFLVFAHHQVVLDSLEKLVSPTYEYVRLDGRTGPEQRNFFCEKFQANEGVRVAILSIMAVNSGVNLSAANLVVFAELFWNPGILVQAEDRAHRIGQIDSVNVQYLVAKNTSDDFIWSMVQNKLELLGQAGISGHTFKEADTKFMADSNQKSITSFLKTEDKESFVGDLNDDDLFMAGPDCNFNDSKDTLADMKGEDEIWGDILDVDDDGDENYNPPKRKLRNTNEICS